MAMEQKFVKKEPPGGTISIYFGGKSWFGTPGAKRLYFVNLI
jgi:hypothetical protein